MANKINANSLAEASALTTIPPRRSFGETRAALSEWSIVFVLVVLFVFFGFTSTYFFKMDNLLNIIKQMSIVGVTAIGMTMVIMIGGIDLSVGSVVLLSGGVAAVLMANHGFSAVPAMLLGLLAAGVVGFINGVLVEVVQISPVIATLGTLIALRGLGQIVIDNTWVWITDPFFLYVAAGKIGPLPVMATIMLVLYLVASVLMRQTVFGRSIYAVGGNPIAAYFCALPVMRTKLSVYVLSSLFAGIAGLMIGATLGVMGPPVGSGLEFQAVAAVVLGGTSLSGGVGRVERTLLGAAIYTMVLNYLTLRGIPDIWQTTVTGFLVLGAVLLDRLARGKQSA